MTKGAWAFGGREGAKSSMAMRVQARGVLVAPAKTATKPSAAKRSTGAWRSRARAWPRVAPMKKRGVTSPPLKPEERVTAVKRIFHHQLIGCAPPGWKAERMETWLGWCGPEE